METGPSICTRNRTMTGLRFLFRVTMRRQDLASEIHHIKEPLRIPQILSAEEAARLLAMAGNLHVRVLLSIGYGAGLRVSEVVRLKVKHIDSSLGIIRVEQAKGRKDRHVMLSPETLALLRAWWPIRTNKYDLGVPVEERWLFPGRRKGLHLTPRQVSRLFQETVVAAGLKKKVTLHTLRHSFATHLFDRGVDIRTIQALLGHEKLETTARYTRVATGLITAVESPLDRLDMPHSAKIAAMRRRRKAKPRDETAVAGVARVASCSGDRGHLPRLRPCVAFCQRRPRQPRPDEGDECHRALPDRGARRPRCAL